MADATSHSQGAIRLVIADVDGTLVTHDKVLTPRAAQAVNNLRDSGIAFTITSGRPPLGMKRVIDDLKLTEPIAAFNGGVLHTHDFKVLDQNFVPASVASDIIDAIASHGLDVWLYTDQDWFIHKLDAPHVAREQWTVGFAPKVVSDFDSHLERVAKIVGVSDDYDRVAKCEKDVQVAGGDHVSAARSQPYYLDVTHPKANKGEVVLTMSRLLKIPTDQIATIGDMPNDVLMFVKSGVSIAMGNASQEVQSSATYVTASNEEEGFALAMEKFIMPRKAAAV